MPRSRKINLEKVRASLDAVCPKGGALIPPAQVRRIDFERIESPVCGERFVPSPKKQAADKNGPTPAERLGQLFGF
jgi:hypothetical protein